MEDFMRSITGLFLIAVIAVPAAVYQISEMTSFKLHTLESETSAKIMTVTTNDVVIGDSSKKEGEPISNKTATVRQEIEDEKHTLRDEKKVENFESAESEFEKSATLTPLQIINQMPMEAWLEIKGIGQVTAERILTLRKEKGGFASLDTLLEVKGIGPAKHAAIMEWVEQNNKKTD
jgi:DNA uptake protein ComE-like DNA-binding protein